MDDDEPYSFESFIRHRPVFRTIEKELEEGGLKGLTPIDRVELAEGMAVSVTQITWEGADGSAARRSDSGGSEPIRSDFVGTDNPQIRLLLWVAETESARVCPWDGRSLTHRRVEGAANYRRVPILVGDQDEDHSVYGTGMPSAPGYVCLFGTGLTR
jgi:hypothetical protein